MKQKILILYCLLFGSLSIMTAQTYCEPEGQNTSGVVIDSVEIIGNPTIIVEGNDYLNVVDDTVVVSGGILEFALYSSTDLVPPITDSVYWRISIDRDADGVFDSTDVVYLSPLVPTGLHIGNTMLPSYNFAFGTARQTRVEMVADPALLGACSSESFPANAIFSSTDFTTIFPDGKLVVKNGSKGKKTTNEDDCFDCLLLNDTLIFEVQDTFQTSLCNISITEIVIRDGNYTKYTLSPADFNIFEIQIFDGGTLKSTLNTQPFDLSSPDDRAIIKATYDLNGSQLRPSGEKGNIFVECAYDVCQTFTDKAEKEEKSFVPFVETGNFSLCIGCYPDTCVVYDLHATSPLGIENELPYYTGSFKSITAKDSVLVRSGDEAIFKVDEAGFIKVEAGVQVKSGSYFWAFKGEPCLIPAVADDPPPIVQNNQVLENRNERLINQTRMEVYPNPFDENLHLQIKNIDKKRVDLEIIDVLGRVVLKQRISSVNTIWDTTQFKSGIYFLKVKIGNTVLTKTIVKSK